jgi:hypothetical protein
MWPSDAEKGDLSRWGHERRFALQKTASLFADHVKPLLH